MTKDNEKRFYQAFVGMCELWEKKFSKALIRIYLNALEGYSADESIDAMTTCAKTLKFFPKPVEIIQAIEGDPEERALNAWDTLLSAIRQHGRYGKILFQDSKIGRLVQTFGGWDAVCSWTNQEVDFRRIEFVRSYKGMGGGRAPLEISGAYSCGPLVMIGLRARIAAWSRNRRGEGKIIDLKRIVPQPWDKEEYETQPVDLAVFRDVSPFIRVSRNETDPGK